MPELIQPKHYEAITQFATKGTNAPVQRRARLLLLYDAGHSTAEVAQQAGLSVSSVLRWRRLYREQGMGIFPDHAEQAAPTPEPAQPDDAPKAAKKTTNKAKKDKKEKKKGGKAKKDKKDKKKGGNAKKDKKKDGKAKKDKKGKKGGKGKKAGKKTKSKK